MNYVPNLATIGELRDRSRVETATIMHEEAIEEDLRSLGPFPAVPPGITSTYVQPSEVNPELYKRIHDQTVKSLTTGRAKAPPSVPIAKTPPAVPQPKAALFMAPSSKAQPKAPTPKSMPRTASVPLREPDDRSAVSGDEDDNASVRSTLSNAAKRRAKRAKQAARDAQGIPRASGGSVGEGNLADAAAAPRAPSTSSTLGSFQVTDAILHTDVASRAPSVASTGRSWEHVPSEVSAMRQGPYTPSPKATAQPAASSSSMATPSSTAVAAVTLVSLFGPSKADKLHGRNYEENNADQIFAYWVLFTTLVVTILLIIYTFMAISRYFDSAESLDTLSFDPSLPHYPGLYHVQNVRRHGRASKCNRETQS